MDNYEQAKCNRNVYADCYTLLGGAEEGSSFRKYA